MNAEIVARLQESFDPAPAKAHTLDEATRRELLASLMTEIAEERLRQIAGERRKE